MTSKEQKTAAKEFASKWAGRGYEKGECQKFWRGLLHDVFEVADPDDWVQYEVQVNTGFTTKFIDAYIPRTKVLIEQKGFTKNLSDKEVIEQALLYVGALPDTMPIRFIVLCNFQEFIILDKHAAQLAPVKVALKDLPKKLRVLSFLAEVQQSVEIVRDVAVVDKKAGELVGRLYSSLLKSYSGEVDERVLESLNMLCVRLVFCAYAEDAGVFPKRDQFVEYMRRYDAEAFRDRLAQLFRMLNTKEDERDPDDIPDLLDFPYVGSGLFDDEHIRIPRFSDETRTMLLDCMCADLDWTEINPTIFGAVFESTLSTAMRRKNGMHYTTVKNIHRVADPLFLWALEKELDGIAAIVNVKKRNDALVAFQKKLGRLRFLDPACGSGNFLTETYISLRRLENRAIMLRQQGQSEFDLGDIICVTIDQFFGIEIDGFAVSVAQTALWIAESQMMIETEKILHRRIDFLPLKRYAHIVKGNALQMDWKTMLGEGERFDYILGNPPFIGSSYCSANQKSEIVALFGKIKLSNSMDYVSGWYFKAAEYMSTHAARAAFVSTNSITQGEQVAPIWSTLIQRFGVEIDFAWRTFVWDSEASDKAHVHCVIIGFSPCGADKEHYIFDESSTSKVGRINPYLLDAPTVFIASRGSSISDAPEIKHGSKPSDGENLILTSEERDELLAKEPDAIKFIRPYSGGVDFLRGLKRYCLWLVGANPVELIKMPLVMDRIKRVEKVRLESSSQSTRAKASTPTLFFTIMQPESGMMLVGPQVSSGRREYIPFGFCSYETIASDKLLIMPNAEPFHFGVLSSSVHNAWVRVVAGRLKSDFTYSVNIVYNNFPWPEMSETNMQSISSTAEAILTAREKYSGCSLADMYGNLIMFPELRKAHQANDAAVLAAYGFDAKATESEIVSRLFERYESLTHS